MRNRPVMDYEPKMKDLIYEYKELENIDTKYVQKETDIFI